MWNEPTKERLSTLPKLYETETTSLKDKLIHLHFFIGDCDWYIAEYDGEDIMWGFCILNNDLEMSEWGYVALSDLKSINIRNIEVDCEVEDHLQPCPANEINRIKKANGWTE